MRFHNIVCIFVRVPDVQHKGFFYFVCKLYLPLKRFHLNPLRTFVAPVVIQPAFPYRDNFGRPRERLVVRYTELLATRRESFWGSIIPQLFFVMVRLSCMNWVKPDTCICVFVFFCKAYRVFRSVFLGPDEVNSDTKLTRAPNNILPVAIKGSEMRMRMRIKVSKIHTTLYAGKDSWVFCFFVLPLESFVRSRA